MDNCSLIVLYVYFNNFTFMALAFRISRMVGRNLRVLYGS